MTHELRKYLMEDLARIVEIYLFHEHKQKTGFMVVVSKTQDLTEFLISSRENYGCMIYTDFRECIRDKFDGKLKILLLKSLNSREKDVYDLLANARHYLLKLFLTIDCFTVLRVNIKCFIDELFFFKVDKDDVTNIEKVFGLKLEIGSCYQIVTDTFSQKPICFDGKQLMIKKSHHYQNILL